MARSTGPRRGLAVIAALIACAPLALGAGLAVARVAPLSDEARAVLGLYAPLPLYALFACLVARAGPIVSWLTCLGAVGAIAWLSW